MIFYYRYYVELKNRCFLLLTCWVFTLLICYLYKEILLFILVNSNNYTEQYFIFTDIGEIFYVYLQLIFFISNTSLNFAGIYGLTDIADALVDAGADLNLINDDNFTPLCNAAAWGHTSIVTILLDAGADLSAKCFETQIGVSVTLSIAIGAPYSDYIKGLYVDHGEKYNIPYDETKIIDGREKVIELLRNR